MAFNAVLPYQHGSLELHSAGLSKSHLYTISCFFFYPICGFGITENQNIRAVSMRVSGGGKHKHTNSSEEELFLEVALGGLRAH